jgi:hypothetical protein
MLELTGAPRGVEAGDEGLHVEPIVARARSMRESVLHDQRCGARWMSCCEQRCRWQRPGAREKDRFATSEIVEHGGDAVGPLLQGWQCVRRDGIGGSSARLVEEDESTERCHRLDPSP